MSCRCHSPPRAPRPAERAADAEGIRVASSFRPLTEAETEAFLGGELLAAPPQCLITG